MVKFLSKTIKLLNAKFVFSKPEQKRILIFDRVSERFIITMKLKKKNYSFLDVRYESINLYVLFYVIINFGFKNLIKNYIIVFIKLVNPKVVLTAIDNNFFFYELNKYYNNPIYISIQNGIRGQIFLKSLKEYSKKLKEDLYADYILIFGKKYKKIYEKYIHAKTIILGHVINNTFNNTQIYFKNKKRTLIFISQVNSTYLNNKNINFRFFLEKKILEELINYCKIRKLELKIYLKDVKLKEYYKNTFLNYKIKFLKRNLKNLNKYDFFVTQSSTLGYELLGRGKKVIFLEYRNIFKKKTFNIFSESYKKKEIGFFWTNIYKPDFMYKILDRVRKISYKKWKVIIKKAVLHNMVFDKNNSIFKEILKNSLK